MRETERRIKIYRARLPKIREKIIASMLIFAVSAATMAVATFSWITLSVAPEVTGMTTTITANGNLEIALAGDDTNFAPPSEVGDSSLKITERNKTWGNLVNLSDAAYGLDNLTLSPAILNEKRLLDAPLSGPTYDTDGRITQLHTQFGYTVYDSEAERFALPEGDNINYRGVRAISSTVDGESSGDVTAKKVANQKLGNINSATKTLQDKYVALGQNDGYMNALGQIMIGYMSHFMKTEGSSTLQSMVSEASISRDTIKNLISMYNELIACYEGLANIYADYLNLQATIDKVDNNDNDTLTGAAILAMDPDTAKATLMAKYTKCAADGILQDIDLFITEYNTLKKTL